MTYESRRCQAFALIVVSSDRNESARLEQMRVNDSMQIRVMPTRERKKSDVFDISRQVLQLTQWHVSDRLLFNSNRFSRQNMD